MLKPIPIDSAFAFSDPKGRFDAARESRQRGLISKLSFLPRFLQRGERVMLVSVASAPVLWWQNMTTFWCARWFKRGLLIWTDRRFIFVPTGPALVYRQILSYVRYGDCEYIKPRGSKIRLRYWNETNETFGAVSRPERKKIQALLSGRPARWGASARSERVSLCPACCSDLDPGTKPCPNCGLQFKSQKSAVRRALLTPGGGYFYAGHPRLGKVFAVGEILLVLILLALTIARAKFQAPAHPWIGISAGLFILVKWLAVYQAGWLLDGFVPLGRVIPIIPSSRQQPTGTFGHGHP